MPPELAPWISPAVIVGFMLYFNRRIEARMNRMESRMDSRMDRLESQIGDLRIHVDTQIGELRERMAHLEGLLEGLREAITRKPAA